MAPLPHPDRPLEQDGQCCLGLLLASRAFAEEHSLVAEPLVVVGRIERLSAAKPYSELANLSKSQCRQYQKQHNGLQCRFAALHLAEQLVFLEVEGSLFVLLLLR
jgi:hypothetical protein